MVNGEIPVPRVYENEHVIVIKDINPQAPTHLLAIPRSHFSRPDSVSQGDKSLFANLFAAIIAVVHKEGLDKKGYRLVINAGSTAGQSVDHIHVHILSGRDMRWPPG